MGNRKTAKRTLNAKLVESIRPAAKPFEISDSKQPGLVLRIQPSGIKSFVCRYARNKRTTIGKSPAVTVAMAREQAKRIIGNGGPITHENAGQKVTLTLGAFIENDYAGYARTHNRAPEDTLKRLRTCYGQWWDRPLTDITTGMVELHRAKERRRGISPATINRDVGRLQSVLSRAVDWDHLDAHPLRGLKPLKLDRKHVVRHLDADEEQRLRAALPHAPDYLQVMVLLSLNTGLRRKELFTLKWSSVDLVRRQLTVVGSLSKTGQTRHIPLNQQSVDALRQWREKTGSDGLVFTSLTGGTFNNTKRSWAALLTAARIENFRWHDLRHHFASRLVMNKVDLYTVGQLLGHSSVELTKRYAHLAPDHLADAVARLDR